MTQDLHALKPIRLQRGAIVRLQMKRLFLNRFTFISLLVLLAYILLAIVQEQWAIMTQETIMPIWIISSILSSTHFIFMFYCIIAYLFNRAHDKHQLLEVARATPASTPALYGSSMLALSLTLIVNAAIVLASTVLAFWYLSVLTQELLVYILLLIFLEMFLTPFLAITLGTLISMIKRESQAIFILILLFSLMSQVPAYILGNLSLLSIQLPEFVTSLLRYTQFFSTDIQGTPDAAMGYSILPYRWWLVLAWLALIFVFLFNLNPLRQRKRQLASGVALMLSIFCLVSYLLPQSKTVRSGSWDDTSMQNMMVYGDDSLATQNQVADFSVLGLELDMKVGRLLNVQATMDLSPTQSSSYNFSLFHNLMISSVTDERSQSISYQQEGDYLYIQAETGKEQTVVIQYEGPMDEYYAHAQGIYLPASFAYYLRPGLYPLYADGAFKAIPVQGNFPIDVQISYPRQVHCNLPGLEPGHYQGTSNSVSLVSGFYQEMELEGIRVVYPYLEWGTNIRLLSSGGAANPEDVELARSVEGSKQLLEQGFKDNLNAGNIPSTTKTIFIMPNTFSGNDPQALIYQYSDHMLIPSFPTLSEASTSSDLPEYKQDLYDLVIWYETYPQDFLDQTMAGLEAVRQGYEAGLTSEDELTLRENSITVRLANLLMEGDPDQLLIQLHAFLESDADTRPIDKLFDDLEGQQGLNENPNSESDESAESTESYDPDESQEASIPESANLETISENLDVPEYKQELYDLVVRYESAPQDFLDQTVADLETVRNAYEAGQVSEDELRDKETSVPVRLVKLLTESDPDQVLIQLHSYLRNDANTLPVTEVLYSLELIQEITEMPVDESNEVTSPDVGR